MGAAWLSGIKLYVTVVTLGLLQHFGLAHLPGDLRILGEWWIIGIAGLLFLVEFVADKIPAVDSVWDSIHTFIRIPAGAVLAAAALGQFDSRIRLLAFLLGGGIALTSHATKAATRVAVNASPEPFSNMAVSSIEDVSSVGFAAITAFHPAVMLGIVAVLSVGGLLIVRKFVKSIRGLLGGSRA